MHDTTRGLEAIVVRQIRLWNLERASRQKTKKGDRHWPVVTISREYAALEQAADLVTQCYKARFGGIPGGKR